MWLDTCLPLWKFATWRFLCWGLTVVNLRPWILSLTSEPPTVLCCLLPEHLSKEPHGPFNRCHHHTQCLHLGIGTGGLLAFTSFQFGHSVQIIVLLSQMAGFPQSSVGKESACNAGDPGSNPELGRSTGEGIGYPILYSWVSLMTQLVKNPPAMQETWVQFLGQEDSLEKGLATHSSILAWRMPWTV